MLYSPILLIGAIMSNSLFSKLFTNNQLDDLFFIMNTIQPNDKILQDVKNVTIKKQTDSDSILIKYPALSFLPSHSSTQETELNHSSDLILSHLSFDGKNLKFTLNTTDPKSHNSKTLTFKASSLKCFHKEYEFDEDLHQFAKVVDDVEENESINDILEDYQHVADIYFSENNGKDSIHILFCNSEIHSDNTGFFQLMEISFNFTDVV